MNFSERAVFEWALVSVKLFKYPRSTLLRWLGESMSLSSYSQDTIKKLEDARDGLNEKKEAAYLLFKDDLDFLVEAMRSFKMPLSGTNLKQHWENGFAYFSKVTGVSISPTPLFLVEHFPESFSEYERSTNLISLPVDSEVGEAGVYVLENSLSPFLPLQLLQEAVKNCFQLAVAKLPEDKLPHRFFRLPWFEDGASLWFALKAYYDTTGDTALLKRFKTRLLMYDRLSPSAMLQHYDLVRELFVSGRLDSALESYLSSPKDKDWDDLLTPIDFVACKDHSEIETFLVDFTHSTPLQYVLPVEYLIMDTIGDGLSLEEFAKKTGLPEDVLKKTLTLLANRQYIFLDSSSVSLNSKYRGLFVQGLIKPSL